MVSASDLSTLSVTVIFAVDRMTSANPLMVARSPLSSVRDVRVISPVAVSYTHLTLPTNREV